MIAKTPLVYWLTHLENMHVIKINILFLAKERLERQIFSSTPSVFLFSIFCVVKAEKIKCVG